MLQVTGSYQASVQLRKAMEQSGYKPDVFMQDPTVYVDEFITSGGSAVEGTTIFTNFVPFAEAGPSRAMQTYLGFLQQSNPSAEPTFFGVFAWSAAVLFTETAAQLGGKLTRESMVAAPAKADDWTAGGLHQKQNVGEKDNGECWRFLTLSGGRWVNAESGAKPICSGVSSL